MTKNRTISMRLDEDTIKYLKSEAKKLNISMSRLIEIFIRKSIKEETTKKINDAIN